MSYPVLGALLYTLPEYTPIHNLVPQYIYKATRKRSGGGGGGIVSVKAIRHKHAPVEGYCFLFGAMYVDKKN